MFNYLLCRLSVFTVLVLPLLVGCGGPKGNQIPVAGSVQFEGQPIAQGTITFMPVSGVGQTTGAQIVNGGYSTDVSPGEMAVQITGVRLVSSSKPTAEQVARGLTEETEQFIPPRYNRQSELRVTVAAEAAKHDFDLKP